MITKKLSEIKSLDTLCRPIPGNVIGKYDFKKLEQWFHSDLFPYYYNKDWEIQIPEQKVEVTLEKLAEVWDRASDKYWPPFCSFESGAKWQFNQLLPLFGAKDAKIKELEDELKSVKGLKDICERVCIKAGEKLTLATTALENIDKEIGLSPATLLGVSIKEYIKQTLSKIKDNK